MNNGVAIRADGAQIFNRINLIVHANLRQGHEMMDMNKILHGFAVSLAKAHSAYGTAQAVMLNAGLAGTMIAFEAVHQHGDSPAFRMDRRGHFLIAPQRAWSGGYVRRISH